MRGRLGLVLACLVAGFCGESCLAQSKNYAELLKRVPDSANAIATVDVNGLLDSPIGKREGWREKVLSDPTAGLGLGLGSKTSKIVIATNVDLSTFEERWKIAMAQLTTAPPALATLAKHEGGYVEQIEGTDVAWTPRNFYLATLPQNVAVMVMPTSRQLMAQWARGILAHPRGFPNGWADRALFRADHGSQIVVAVELADAISTAQTEAWLRTIDAVTDGKFEPKFLAKELASVKSAFLQVEAKDGISGTLHVEFANEIDAIKPIAKELITEALVACGADVEDLRSWTLEIKGSTLELSGALELGSVRRILSLFAAPSLSVGHAYESDGETPKPPATAAESTQQDVVLASQRYFRAVVGAVDSLKQQKNESFSRVRFWLDRTAKQIDELPILNVDSDLLDWGGKVALTLREMSMSINYINKDKSYRLAGSAKGAYMGWWGGGTWSSMDSRSTNRQADVMINVDATTRWNALQTAIGEMRRAMVQKYKVDF